MRDSPAESSSRIPSISQEAALLNYAERLDRHRARRIAVQIHLSRLQGHNRREHHVRVAVNTFEELVKQFDGQIFHLMNHDIVFVCKGARAEAVDEAVLKLRYLFSEDPLTRLADDQTGGGFCTWYLLAQDYDAFLSMARRVHELGEAHRAESRRLQGLAQREQRVVKRPLAPADLARLVEALANTDISSMVRGQEICAMTATDAPQPVFRELYVSIDDLEETLLPGVSLTADPWLFQHLTQVLDRRMLAHVLKEEQGGQASFSLNLNVATVLSGDFQRFDQGIGLGVRGRLVIEVQQVDIVADMAAYLFARDYLRERGYKICLDGLTHLTLPLVERERLGIDLIKLAWNGEAWPSMRPEALGDLERHIRAVGRARIILTRCDSEGALDLGQRLGISLFQGRYVDYLLANAPLAAPAPRRQGMGRASPSTSRMV
jgi:hypothetical protein